MEDRNLISSRYILANTLQTPGILKAVKELTMNAWFWDCLSTEVPIYCTLTMEFLASFNIHPNNTEIHFQMDGKAYALTIEDVNKLMQANHKGNTLEAEWPDNLSQEEFKQKLIGDSRTSYRAN